MTDLPAELIAELSRLLAPERVHTRPIDRIAYASDASFYRLTPRVVVQPTSVAEIQSLFRFSHSHRIPMTFRAAGTSLSGQAITDGILVDISKHWRRLEVEDEGRRVRVQPGVIGGTVNARLASHRTKLGPDPASINACMVGGILANNSSGMCCGIAQNSYRTLESLTFLLPSGLVLDTADPGAGTALLGQAPEIAHGLCELKRSIERSPNLAERIRTKYRIKNTTGYSLNAFLDFDRPIDVLRHLMVGSEGTLGFIAEAVLRTVPDHPVKSTGLLFFHDVGAACSAIAPLRDSGAATLELMDRASLRSIENENGVPEIVRGLPARAASLLVEYQAASARDLAPMDTAARRVFASLPLLETPLFTRDPREQEALWRVRKGLFTSVGATREPGTSVIMEDVAFPVPALAAAVVDLQDLFVAHGYDRGIIFGHAKDGNVHFVITQSFNDDASVHRYEAFMADVAELVVGRYDGSLKAEHGTGRNVAPFVAKEWGTEAYAVMQALKALIDPTGLLNPGVILNPDPRAHVQDLKPLPIVEPEVDKCIECGWCERMCPSRDLTVTPRQRIVIQREIARLRAEGGGEAVRALLADYDYAVVETCATDGMCATGCPVGINTGLLVRRMRGLAHSPAAKRLAAFAARHLGAVERLARAALVAGHVAERFLGASAVKAVASHWQPGMPRAARASVPAPFPPNADAVSFSSCLSRVLGPVPGDPSCTPLVETMARVASRAGVVVGTPAETPGHCCGLPFSSKGYAAAHREALHRTIGSFWTWSDRGRLPIVVDTSSCAYALRTCREELDLEDRTRYDRLRILDGIEFAHDVLLPRLERRRGGGSVVLHPICSSVKMGTVPKLVALAQAFADSVTVPIASGCCGFAGDRGLLFPELTASATRAEAEEVTSGRFDGHYSSGRTCELGMTRATGRSYRSFWDLLDLATTPALQEKDGAAP